MNASGHKMDFESKSYKVTIKKSEIQVHQKRLGKESSFDTLYKK